MNFVRSLKTEILHDATYLYETHWLDYVDDNDLRRALIAVNVNIVRRAFPHVFLLCRDTDAATLKAELNDPLVSDLPAISFSGAMHWRDLSRATPSVSAIVDLDLLDVFPVAHLLEYEEYALLCLRERRSLSDIATLVSTQSLSAQAEFSRLLQKDGVLVTVQDGVCFRLLRHLDILE